MFPALLLVHILICVALIIVVLLQSAKGEGLAGAFGGGGGLSGAVFGGRGAASFLSKATTVLAILFMVSCLSLSLLSAGKGVTQASVGESAVTQAAQQEAAAQQAAQQQAGQPQQEGQTASPEDLLGGEQGQQPAPQPSDSK